MTCKRNLFSFAALLGVLSLEAFAAGPVVAVNQAGYTAAAQKIGIISAFADSFRVVRAATRETVFFGATGVASLGDAATGMELWNADFSSVQSPGEYILFTSNGDSSQHFFVADSVYNQVFRKSLKGFYYQRCGMTLSPVHAGQSYWHTICHTVDGTFHPTAEGTGTVDVKGGWHDAGDYGKYIVNAGISTGTLLAAYEWFPSKFAADDLNIPESGNGIPDILDEVRYELNWFLKMQRSSDGGVYFKVTHEKFEGFVKPENDGGVRYIYQLSSTATGNFVAVMARAARVFQPFNSGFAATCLAAAVKGWQYLQAHPQMVPTGGFKNPAETATGEYGDGSDSDERLWAAAELYLANGDASAHAYFTANYASGGILNQTMAWPDLKPLAELTYLRGNRAGISASVQDQIRQSLITYAGQLLTLRENSGFGSAMSVNDYVWGSNSQALNNALLLIMASEEGGKPAFLQAALDQLHYVLGVNAHGISFVTGIGARHTMRPHHRPSATDGVQEPVPGLIAGGPNRNVKQDPVLERTFTSATPPALCYVDHVDSYASNEICINWNAPLVFVAGYFNLGTLSSVGEPSGSNLQERFRLEQNYPNPFNGTTLITFTVQQEENLDFRVIDMLGRTVLKKSLGRCASGEHQLAWSAAGEDGAPLSSGAYFYFIEGTYRSPVRKLMLLN
jgi:endoglucanase